MDQDHSHYIRDLIDRDRLDKRDKSYINSKRAYFKAELKKLDYLEKQGSQLGNSEDIISEFHQDPERPQIYDNLSRNVCFKYFKTKYWPKIRNLPEYKLKNPVDVFNDIIEEADQ